MGGKSTFLFNRSRSQSVSSAVKLSGGSAVQPDSLLFSDVYHLLHFQQRSPLKPPYLPPLPHSAKCKALSCQQASLFGHSLHIWDH